MKKIFLSLAGLVAALCVSAKVSLPEIIGDNMVLQQNADVMLWGWADPHASVKIRTSWGAKASAVSNDDGYWQTTVRTPEGGFVPQRITVRSGETVTLENILIGEVWFASGQSNMEMSLGGYWNAYVEGADDAIAFADEQRDRIRYLRAGYSQSYTPKNRAEGKWNVFNTATAPRCSATAYFFAETLSRALNVPVGVIDSSWGGSRLECWTSREKLAAYPDIDLSESAYEAEKELHMRPMAMYNAMVLPFAKYTLRGFLWYQGESNIGHHDVYAQRMADMVEAWREAWGGEQKPFFFVEIAPFNYGHGLAAYLREAQYEAQKLIPGSGMVSTNDLVEPYESANIHPADKRDVGRRLAFWALNRTYGREQVACEGMRFRSMDILDGKAFLSFDFTAASGFGRLTDIRGFEICGPDHVFHPAEASVEDNKRIVVCSPKVSEPVAVRYGFGDFMPGNVVDRRRMPLVPFRTDDF